MNMLCHYGNVECFRIGNAVIYGGGVIRGAYPLNGMIVLDLADEWSRDPIVEFVGCRPPKELVEETLPKISILKFKWGDFDIPMLSREFWRRLVDWLRAEGRPVLVCCSGGHGRTGTALSILASLSGACKGDPIKYIRRIYCAKAVESKVQITYIEEITGKKSKCKQLTWDVLFEEADK